MDNCTVIDKCSTDVVYAGYVYILTSVSVLGTVFNVINLCVFGRKAFQSKIAHTTLSYLTGLAVADAVASFGFIPLGPFRCNPDTEGNIQIVWRIYEMFIFLPLVNTFAQASIWITLMISTERCIFIAFYAGWSGSKDGLWPQHTKKIVIVLYASAVIFNLPFWFYYDVHRTLSTGVAVVSDFGNSLGFEVWSWARVILGKIIPIIGVIVFNAVLVKVTWINNKRYRIMNLATALAQRRQNAQDRMTAMLLSISIVFAMTHALEPFLLTNIYTEIAGPCSNYTDLYNTLLMIVNVAESVSFASNFVSYCSFNTHFVTTMKDMFSCFKCHCCYNVRRRKSVVSICSVDKLETSMRQH